MDLLTDKMKEGKNIYTYTADLGFSLLWVCEREPPTSCVGFSRKRAIKSITNLMPIPNTSSNVIIQTSRITWFRERERRVIHVLNSLKPLHNSCSYASQSTWQVRFHTAEQTTCIAPTNTMRNYKPISGYQSIQHETIYPLKCRRRISLSKRQRGKYGHWLLLCSKRQRKYPWQRWCRLVLLNIEK